MLPEGGDHRVHLGKPLASPTTSFISNPAGFSIPGILEVDLLESIHTCTHTIYTYLCTHIFIHTHSCSLTNTHKFTHTFVCPLHNTHTTLAVSVLPPFGPDGAQQMETSGFPDVVLPPERLNYCCNFQHLFAGFLDNTSFIHFLGL